MTDPLVDADAGPVVDLRLPISSPRLLAEPSAYLADQPLEDAIDVALTLGQPLLLTGEPGCGKTQLAGYLAWKHGLGSPLKFETKSDSTSASLFYRYDSLRHFERAARGEAADPLDFVTLAALGSAIVAAMPVEARPLPVSDERASIGPMRSVVLIDEVDKAPRDFPNDLLNELEQLYFRIPECGNLLLEADDAFRPIVVITSNSERDLPEAFLRRCVFHHLRFPDDAAVRQIALTHLGDYIANLDAILDDALRFFGTLRSEGVGLSRPPGLAEFLGWLIVVGQRRSDDGGADEAAFRRSLGILAKNADDLNRARRALDDWRAGRTRR